VGADGAAHRRTVSQFDRALSEVARAKSAAALGALDLCLRAAALLAAALRCIAFANVRPVSEVLFQVLFLPRAILRVTDLLVVTQAVAVLVAEATTAILTHSYARLATGPESARDSALGNHQIVLGGV
jgi:hypothetical protein